MKKLQEEQKIQSLKDQGIKTLSDLFEDSAKRWVGRNALRKRHEWGYQEISYKEFNRLISFLGTGFILEGLEKNDKVILIGENSPEWALVYASVTSSNSIIVPLDPMLKENEIRHLLMHSEAKFLVTSLKIYKAHIENMHIEGVKVILIGEDDSGELPISLGKIMANGKKSINDGESSFFQRKSEISADDTAAICYTSGTTGKPKGAVLLHRNIISDLDSIRKRALLLSDDNFLCILPLYHTFATTCVFLTAFTSGSTVVFSRSLKPNIILQDVKEEDISVIVAVPLLLEHLMEFLQPEERKDTSESGFFSRFLGKIKSGFSRLLGKTETPRGAADMSGLKDLKLCISGAAPLRPDIEKDLISAGIPLVQGYGLTEASPVVSFNPPENPVFGTVGTALDGIDVEINNPNEEGVGEIVVTGENVMKEYYKNPDATNNVLKNGRLFTGDLGRMDPDGYITIMGRQKSVIITPGGKNIYPDELELLLNRDKFILESAIVKNEDKRGNVRIAAIIVPDYDTFGSSGDVEKPLTEEGIKSVISNQINKISDNLPDYKRISDFQIRDEELPRTTTNKLKRHMISWVRE
ncbi:MAG: AMP-binding protein [Candidatus Krumholzibacteriota bacterium]|nr:AMP-binding protein [Candidatus Krumholzibacteriota bacterium]